MDNTKKSKRDRYIKIRLTTYELERVEQRAEELGLDKSDFFRQLAIYNDLPKRQIIHKVDSRLLRQLSMIGNNINQIAKRANTDNEVTQKTLLALFEIQTMLDRLVADFNFDSKPPKLNKSKTKKPKAEATKIKRHIMDYEYAEHDDDFDIANLFQN